MELGKYTGILELYFKDCIGNHDVLYGLGTVRLLTLIGDIYDI